MTNVYIICIAKRLLLTPRVHFHLLMDWLTCVIVVQLKEFRQAVEDRHTHLYQNPYYPTTTQSSRSNIKCWCRYMAVHLEFFQETCICMYVHVHSSSIPYMCIRTSFHDAMRQRVPVYSEVHTYVLQGVIHYQLSVGV